MTSSFCQASLVITLLCLDSLSSYGHPEFAVAGQTVWNSQSDDLRDPTLSTDSFRRLLKTRLFSENYYIQHIRGIALYVLYKFTTYFLIYSTGCTDCYDR